MKTTNPTPIGSHLRAALKNSALALTLGAAVFFGSGPPANAAMSYDFSTGLQGWTKIYPTTGDLWANYDGWGWMPDDGHLGAGWEDADTILGRSPAFTLDLAAAALTFQLIGSASILAAPDVDPSAIPEIATIGGGFIGVALRDVDADKYVLSKGLLANNYSSVWTDLSFSAGELAPFVIPDRVYTLDFIDYSKLLPNGDGWVILNDVSIPGTLAIPESSVTLLGGLGFLALLRRRRNA